MAMRMKAVAVVLASALLAAVSLAGDIAGKWKGSIVIEADKETMAKINASGKQNLPTVTLEFKADKTYTATQTGGPDKSTHKSSGTWSQSGNKVSVTPKTRDGKAVTGEQAKPKVYTLSKDGSTMSMDMSAQIRQAAQSASNKQAMPKMTVKIVLKKS